MALKIEETQGILEGQFKEDIEKIPGIDEAIVYDFYWGRINGRFGEVSVALKIDSQFGSDSLIQFNSVMKDHEKWLNAPTEESFKGHEDFPGPTTIYIWYNDFRLNEALGEVLQFEKAISFAYLKAKVCKEFWHMDPEKLKEAQKEDPFSMAPDLEIIVLSPKHSDRSKTTSYNLSAKVLKRLDILQKEYEVIFEPTHSNGFVQDDKDAIENEIVKKYAEFSLVTKHLSSDRDFLNAVKYKINEEVIDHDYEQGVFEILAADEIKGFRTIGNRDKLDDDPYLSNTDLVTFHDTDKDITDFKTIIQDEAWVFCDAFDELKKAAPTLVDIIKSRIDNNANFTVDLDGSEKAVNILRCFDTQSVIKIWGTIEHSHENLAFFQKYFYGFEDISRLRCTPFLGEMFSYPTAYKACVNEPRLVGVFVGDLAMDQTIWFKKQVDFYDSLDEGEIQRARFDLVNDVWLKFFNGGIDSARVPDFHDISISMGKPTCTSNENDIAHRNLDVLLFIKQVLHGGGDPRILAFIFCFLKAEAAASILEPTDESFASEVIACLITLRRFDLKHFYEFLEDYFG